MLTEPAGG